MILSFDPEISATHRLIRTWHDEVQDDEADESEPVGRPVPLLFAKMREASGG